MKSRRLLIGLGVLVASLVTASETCHAQVPYYFPYGGTGLPLHYIHSNYLNGRPPFYAEFPPVYYSYPIARPYGQYPFAYTPNSVMPCATVPVEPAQPQPEAEMVYNPFVSVAKSDRPKTRQPEPLVVLNPYVDQTKVAADKDELPRVVRVGKR